MRRTTAIGAMAVVVMDKAPYHVRLKAPALKDLGKKTRNELIEVVRKAGLKRQMWQRRPRQLRRLIYKPLFSPSDPNCFCAPAFFDREKRFRRPKKFSRVQDSTCRATAPAEGLAWLHDRQPVVLRGEAAAGEWLRRGDRPDVCARLTRGTAEGLTSHMVSPAIGKASEWQGPERGLRAVHAAQAHARGRRHPRLLQRGAVAQAASGRPRGGRRRAAGGGGGAAEARQARARALMMVL